ncbi:MAG: ABC transporter ATP-binding protein [Candidatus Rokubacteria bacterium]|nr:ABC transporter ATP-binding protein [Candidatus Rokubacteria bacterium]
MSLLRLHDVTKRFAPHDPPAVDALSLAAEPGEILTLLGPSGCGKTTTLRLIAGFEVPDRGTVELRGQLMAGNGTAVPPEARGVGMVFQDYALFPHLPVAENVAFGLGRFDRATRALRVGEVLELVGLGALAGRYPHELSGGQQQRVALARALAPAPALICLDEPFSNLDADLRAVMREEVEKILRTTGTTAIFVTHDQQEAFTLADRVGVLNAGHLEQLDVPYEVYHHPATRFVAEFVGEADFLRGFVKEEGIVTEIGTVANPGAHPTGIPVDIMIRPDDIDFIPHPEGDVMVVDRQFHGAENLYRLRLASGARVHSVQPSTAIYPIGTRVRLVANLIHVVAFPLTEGS